MDSFGYRNWGSTGSYLEDSESPEASPDHTAPNRRTSGNSRYSQSKATNDDYDFEISDSNDYEVSPEPAKQKNSYSSSLRGDSSTRYGSTRRTSVADRAKEILERNKSAKQVADDDDGPSTFQSTYAELLEGLEFNKTDDTPDESMLDIVSPKSDVRATRQKSFLGSPGLDSSSYGDSFEISAADFEVK